MDKKKLIGTIIGVVLFAALIAGATFAWLTFNASITNGNYAAGTMEFVIKYKKGTDINGAVPVLTAGDTSNAASLNVQAYRTTNSTVGDLQIKMTTTSNNTLTTSGVLKYAVCSGTESAAGCSGNLSNVEGNVLSVGEITIAGENVLYETADIKTDATTAYYWIFFWLDQSMITNEMTEGTGMEFAGYIHASAQQR